MCKIIQMPSENELAKNLQEARAIGRYLADWLEGLSSTSAEEWLQRAKAYLHKMSNINPRQPWERWGE